jgi:imidazoleglycerol-phosphate dehydratase
MSQATRSASVARSTKETAVELSLVLDGTGTADVSTGIGFLDHMFELFAYHGGFDLSLHATGDLQVDGHHTVEDIGLVLGQALQEALADKAGIRRYGSCLLPMDEALALVAVDVSGRPFLVYDANVPPSRLGDYDTELTEHFLRSFVTRAAVTVHVRLLSGDDAHHQIEAVFKGLARALREACAAGGGDAVPSTKGVL